MGKRIIRCQKLLDDEENPTIYADECLLKKGKVKPNNQSCLRCANYKADISPLKHESQKTSTKPSIKHTKESQEEKQPDRAEPKTFSRKNFIRLKTIKADPEFISIMEQVNNINKRIDDIGDNYKNLPATSEQKYDLRNDLCEEGVRLNALNEELDSLYDKLKKKFGFTIPELANEDIEEKHFREFDPFYDGKVVEVIPYKPAKATPNPRNPDISEFDADPTYDLWPDPIEQKSRYLQVRIDTWQTAKTIIATLRKILAPFSPKTRFRETEITLPVLEKKAQGKTDAEITREIYHVYQQPIYNKKADRYRKRVSRAHKKSEVK